jgi:hypothetical protein
MIKYLIILAQLTLLFFSSTVWAATLVESNWSTGSTCNTTNLADGVWVGDFETADCSTYLGIGTGGPGDRNYLRYKFYTSDVGSVLFNNPSSLSNPSTVYVRFWINIRTFTGGNMHIIWLNNEVGNYGACLYRGYTTGDFSILPNGSSSPYHYSPGNLSLNTWYRLEYKVTGGGSSSGSIEVRLDGVDITDSMLLEDGGGATLADNNGNLTIPAINYTYLSMYYDSFHSSTNNFIDITGYKITDGPDWIGGDDEAPTPSRKLNNVTGNRVSLH